MALVLGSGVTALIWALFLLMCMLSVMLTISRYRAGPHTETLTYALTTALLALLFALYLAGSHLSS